MVWSILARQMTANSGGRGMILGSHLVSRLTKEMTQRRFGNSPYSWDGWPGTAFQGPLLFLFFGFAPRCLRLFDDLLLQLCRYDVVTVHFHVETAPTLGHR